MPSDGGLYVPDGTSDLRKWILYTNENTTFSSIAGALTSAFINNEYSPIICETIATRAFNFEPKLIQLDDNLFSMELFHGPTCCYRDFGVSYLVSLLETTCQLENKKAVLLDYTSGEHGAILAKALKGKKHVKSVLVYPKDGVSGITEEDFIWNGGNILPVQVDGGHDEGHNLVKSVFADRELSHRLNLTSATTANIGRLIPQTFSFTYAFSRLKNIVSGDIFYALDPENYGNLVAGLYGWRLSLPVNGFILPATPQLTTDSLGNPFLPDSIIPFNRRTQADVSDPSNLERLEDFFSHYAAMMKNFVYLSNVTEEETVEAEKELFVKYHHVVDKSTAKAYAAAKHNHELIDEEEGTIVLIDRFHPAFSKDFIKFCTGESVETPEEISAISKTVELNKPLVSTKEQLASLIESI